MMLAQKARSWRSACPEAKEAQRVWIWGLHTGLELELQMAKLDPNPNVDLDVGA